MRYVVRTSGTDPYWFEADSDKEAIAFIRETGYKVRSMWRMDEIENTEKLTEYTFGLYWTPDEDWMFEGWEDTQ